jgi:hypothetical protein
MTVTYVDRIGTLPVLAVAYSLGDPTITLDFCPADVLAKSAGEFPCSLGSVLFRVTALGAGNVVWSVTRDPRTADVAQVIGTPVLVQFAGWQLEEPQQATFVTVDDESGQYPNSVQQDTAAADLFMAQNFR